MKITLFRLRETSQKAFKCAGPLAAVAAMALLGVSQVRAQAVGYVWNNNPATSGTTTPDSGYSYNSSGGAISITRNSVGNYTVTFAGLGKAATSNVQVSAYGPGPDFCVSGGWDNETDVTANVYCYDEAGSFADHSFTLLYQARLYSDPAQSATAYLWADDASAPNYTPNTNFQYNSTAGTNTIVHEGTGGYLVTLPGLDKTGGTVLATAYGSAARCQVTEWNSSKSSGTVVSVNCSDAAGAPVDAEFTLVYSYRETPGFSDGVTGASIWAFNDTKKTPYNVSGRYSVWIDGVDMYAQRTGKGTYAWTITVDYEWTSSTAIVTAIGAPGSYCSVHSWDSTSTTTTVYVNCFDGAGKPVDAEFTATFQIH